MIRGVSFNISHKSENILHEVLNCIDVEKYSWYNIESQNEVWNNYDGGIYFEKPYYDGKSFLQKINSEHFIIFLKLQAYFKNADFFDIHTYNDFQKSDCQILILINDCEFVEIYTKDIIISEKIYKNSLKNNFGNVKYITDDNDGRTKMDVL